MNSFHFSKLPQSPHLRPCRQSALVPPPQRRSHHPHGATDTCEACQPSRVERIDLISSQEWGGGGGEFRRGRAPADSAGFWKALKGDPVPGHRRTQDVNC
ncbi:hypothetical protein AAFF_G00031050 [Aldrovandia affinis]|uniref:Uncharacterized protein n=1 Tax=Aldrovandia affinis TaxID=143900 RepID=A0AAD7WGZ3_9TELE|nr:hypothetical protein AAFF_G00031050 [Aldrovandia affinis]